MSDGSILDGWRLGELIAFAGAQVHRAEPIDSTGPPAVIKIARTAAAVEMLKREAAAAARVDHPRVVTPISIRLDHAPPYLVFPRWGGGTLDGLIRREHGLSAPTAARIFDDILEGLAALHAAGVAHGDLKPANVLLDGDGRAAVADLGLAVIGDGPGKPASAPGAGSPQSDSPAGTWYFMAPEVRAGATATPAADVYSAGLLLNAMLNQHPIHGVLDPVSRAELPNWAATVIESSCTELKHRPADAAELRELFASARPPQASAPAERRPPPRADNRPDAPAAPAAESGFAEIARGYKVRLERPGANQNVGGWVLDEPIGNSRFGETWKAHRRDRPGEIAAIKLFSEPRFLSNLRADRELAGNLRHCNIAALLEADVHAERPYVVMEFVDGRPLRDRLRQGPLPPRQALSLTTQILSGLAAAHAVGLAHRNLKPENVLLRHTPLRDGSASWRAVITDFGLGKAVEETVCQMSMSGIDWSEFAPYWRYLSPEQEAGNNGTVASDVYSAGLIHYEMLIGCLPPAVLREETLRDLPAGVRPTLMKALAPVGERFPTAREFLAALVP